MLRIYLYQDTRRYWLKEAEHTRKVIASSFTWRISATTKLVLRFNYHNTAESRGPNVIIDSSRERMWYGTI